MEPDVKKILNDIPTLEDDQLDNIGTVFSEMHQQYAQEFGNADEKTRDAFVILDALQNEKSKREARKTYNKLPDTYNEFMTMALEGDRTDGLSKEDVK